MLTERYSPLRTNGLLFVVGAGLMLFLAGVGSVFG